MGCTMTTVRQLFQFLFFFAATCITQTSAFQSPRTLSAGAGLNSNSAPSADGTPRFEIRSAEGALRMAPSPPSTGDRMLDVSAVGKYASAVAVQMAAFTAVLRLIDYGIDSTLGTELPAQVVGAMFFILSLRSRVFSPLNNQRPNIDELAKDGKTQGFRDRVMPKWTPPGPFFPIMWILVIAPLRAYSSVLVYQANGGHLCDPTILALLLHLSLGDTWNTINNVERRLGAAVPGVLTVLSSAAFASSKYYEVDETAGTLLGLTCVWLTVASVLVTDTWRLNPLPSGERDKLYPVVGDAETRFVFER